MSIALNKEFSIQNITENFFERLKPEHRELMNIHIADTTNKNDFEECIAKLEQFNDALVNYYQFLESNKGVPFVSKYDLDIDELKKNEKSIQETIHIYMALIQEIVNGNVKIAKIRSNLAGFVRWFKSILEADNDVDLFTLNYDLLLETILIRFVNEDVITTDFFDPAGPWIRAGIKEYRHYFNPKKALRKKPNCKTKIYHLHGSLSCFKDLTNNKTFKVRTDIINDHKIYSRINELCIVPAIITGGKKNDKIQEEPFNYYFNELHKKLTNENHLCDKLYIIGYSFRDEHINKIIKERINLSYRQDHPRSLEIAIIDYADTINRKNEIRENINHKLGYLPGDRGYFVEDDSRILFDGANCIQVLIDAPLNNGHTYST